MSADIAPAGGIRKRAAGERDLTRPSLPEALPVPVYDNHTHLEFEDGLEVLDPQDSLD